MGGGLAAEAAGAHAALVRAAVLLDPVNYALESANVPWTGLAAQASQSQLPHRPAWQHRTLPHVYSQHCWHDACLTTFATALGVIERMA